MTRLLPLLLLAGCLAERAHQRDDRLFNEVSKQERWAQDAVAAKLSPEDLVRVRRGDEDAVRSGRKTLRKLVSAVDRGTWIRDAAVESMREDGQEAGLVADFEGAGRTRNEALQAADELATALAEPRDGASLGELRAGLDGYRRARESETRLAKDLGKASDSRTADGGTAEPKGADSRPADSRAGDSKARPSPLSRLSTVALPVPRPFIGAIARFLWAHQAEKLTGFAAEDATEIRAQLADLEAHPPETPAVAAPSEAAPGSGDANASPLPAAGNASSAGSGSSASAGSPAGTGTPASNGPSTGTLTVANDAQKLIAKRGAPRSFSAREGGLFALRYEEQRPCGIDTCAMDVDYLFDAQGKLVRDEATPVKK